jgi:hypothetical protein
MEKTNMKCVFCDEVLSGITVDGIYKTEGCDTCGYGSKSYATVTVRCDKCNRVIYTKEVENG